MPAQHQTRRRPVIGGIQIPDPPQALIDLSETIEHPLVRRAGVTTTEDGHWALYVTVPKTAEVPIPDLESRGFPVVYDVEPDEPLRPFQS